MIALGPLAAAWGFSAYLRCPDAKIARNLVSVAGLIVLWMLAVLVKFHLDNDLVESLLWYCYYIPMTVIPLLCLDCALRAAALDDKPATRHAMRVFAGITAALIALVLTNNLHHVVFVFDFADASWSAATAMRLATISSSAGKCCCTSRSSPRFSLRRACNSKSRSFPLP